MYVFAYIKLYNVRGYKYVTVNLKDKNRKKKVFLNFLVQSMQLRNEENPNLFLVRNIDKGDFMSCFQENCWQDIKLQGS